MQLKFNSPDLLPPVGCELLIKDHTGAIIRVRRASHIKNKHDQMEYITDAGIKIIGRFPWSYP